MVMSEHQVFISFRGADVRRGFLSFLVNGLKRGCVKYYVDTQEMKGQVLDILLQRIQESRLVLIILSQNYMESRWCIKELLETTKEMIGPKRKVIPIFYNVRVEDVKENWKVSQQARGEEGEEKVKEALRTLTRHMGIRSSEYRNDFDFIEDIVKEVKKVLMSIELEEKAKASVDTSHISKEEKQDMSMIMRPNMTGERKELETTPKVNFFGITQRLQKLQEKLGMESEISKETRIIGLLGMAGIGKTTLAMKLFEKGRNKFHRRMFFSDIHKTTEEKGLTELRSRLLKKLLKKTNMIIKKETTHESVEAELLDGNVFLVLDNLTNKQQLEYLLGDKKWISKGSKIVIVTSDKSLVEDVVNDIYVVPGLNEREGLECFCHHAFSDNKAPEENLMKLSREFVDYARGNPLALNLLALDVRGRDKAHWESKLLQLAQSPSKNIQDVLNVSYNGLTHQQKEAFLDVTCFFRSENHKFVTALVDSEPQKGTSEIKDLADKFLIDISSGRVEMHSLLYKLGKKLASQEQQRLCNHQEIIKVLKRKPGKIIPSSIIGMFLDMSEVGRDIALSKEAFDGMDSLQYLKIFNSQEDEADYGLNFSNGLKLPLQEIRYLHWLKFPEEELPPYFNAANLIDLKLPCSKIKRLWDGFKDTSKLTWVDLSHSVNLCDFSGLLGAENLQRLNLEGCTELDKLHAGMQNLKSLVYLNLRGCKSLASIAKMNMDSLKTLILSDCSNLVEFQVISEQLEALYLDGTGLKGLPASIVQLQKLVLLNLKGCTKLATVPDCLGNMKALQEVILSGCSELESFPDLQENMRRLRIFLLDGTSIKEVPKLLQSPGVSELPYPGAKGLPLLTHLCLRGNSMIQSLQPDIGQLYHLKCIDLMDCKNIASIPTLPPNLQRLNAHGCESLTTLGNPLVHLVLTDQIHSTFVFSNCHKLDEDAKTGIISYIQKKSQLMSNALDRYNLGSVLESFVGACFPGCEVPAWLSHQTYGSVILLPELSRHWSKNGSIGVALCAVVSFTDYQDQNHRFLVKCTCEFKNKDGSSKQFSCTVGGNEPRKIESDHVFIGYTSWMPIKILKEEENEKNRYSHASLRFEVTDGAGEVVKKCQVLKCGFSLAHESDETECVSWEVNSDPNGQRMDNNNSNGVSMVSAGSEDSEIINCDDENQRMDEINQHGEISLAGYNSVPDISMLHVDSVVTNASLRMGGDNSINGALISSADSEMEKIHQQRGTSYWATWPKDLSFFFLSCFNPGKEKKMISLEEKANLNNQP